MRWTQSLILLAFAAILLVPFFARRAERGVALSESEKKNAAKLIVVTPHIEQIRVEFADAFDRWHRRTYGQPVIIDYRTPGGTTEILKLLEAMYTVAMQRELAEIQRTSPARLADPELRLDEMKAGDTDFDLMFGGGTFDHDRLRSRGATISVDLPVNSGKVKITLARPRDGLRGAGLQQLAFIETRCTLSGGKSMTLRVPVAAVTGGVKVLEPFTGETKSVEAEVDLGRCKRIFNVRMSTPPQPMFTDDEMKSVYGGVNLIGVGQLYQDNRGKDSPNDQQHWFGAALSGFGIVYNRPLNKALGVPPPNSWKDLCRPEYSGLLAMADPRLSGSVATLYDSILNSQGFDEGFRTLRDMCGNARNFAAASTQPPMDVSQGDAVVGVAIDFYGRFQAQSVLRPGETAETGRVAYVDPPGAVYVDADPVSVLRGGPNPQIARRFVEFCLTEEAQTLWQYPALNDPASAKSPVITGDPGGRRMGPDHFVLRRMPIRRSMYEPAKFALFADKTNLFEIASGVPTKGWRDGMIMIVGCAGIDTWPDLRKAWMALKQAEATPSFPAETLARMRAAFYAMPMHEMADGSKLEFNEKNYAAISKDTGRFRDPKRGPQARIAYTEFFRGKYREVVAIASGQALAN